MLSLCDLVLSCCNLWFIFRLMVFNTTFNNISVISWWQVLFVEETEVPGENHWTAARHKQIYYISCIEYTSPWVGLELTTLVLIGTDCTGKCKSNYSTIMTMTTPAINGTLRTYINRPFFRWTIRGASGLLYTDSNSYTF